MKDFTGMGVALVTPFQENGQVDYRALEHLVNYQIDNGTDYLVVLGTTAETPTLSKQEQQRVTETVVRVNAGRLPIVLGVGGNNTMEMTQAVKQVDTENIDAILSVVPYYNKPSQEGIYRHFAAIAQVTELPVILYNVPYRTGTNMTPETVFRLAADFENIIGIKEASGNFEQALELIRNQPEDFYVISGEDKLALSKVLAGGAGVISVIGQGIPEVFSRIIHLGLNGQSQAAFDLFFRVSPLIDLIFAEGNPAGIKSLLQVQGICERGVRLPLMPASDEIHQKIRNFAVEFKNQYHVIEKN